MKQEQSLKLYIIIKDSIPVGKAITAASHASLIAHLQWNCNISPNCQYDDWLTHSFKKVVLKCGNEVFDALKNKPDAFKVITQSTLNNMEVGMVICPSYSHTLELKELLSSLKLYS